MRLFALRFYLVSCYIIALTSNSKAQSTGWQELTISDGLSQGMIHEIRQDEHGFIWIGTNDGLNRYDGHNFKVFTHNPYNEYSISGDFCTALFIDSQKRLWVGTQAAGLNLYNQATHRFYHIDLKSKLNSHISYINEDPQGNLWVSGFEGELLKIILNDSLKTGFPTEANFIKSVTVLQIGTLSPNRVITPFIFDSKGLAYICDKDEFLTLNWKNPSKIAHIQSNFTEIPFTFFQKQSKQSRLWLTQASLSIVSQQLKILSSFTEISRNNEVSLTTTALGHLLIVTRNAVWLMQSSNDLLTENPLLSAQCLLILPETKGITACFEDNHGTIWVGTNGYGLRKFNTRIRQFRGYLPNLSLANIYLDRQGRCYVRVENKYYIVDKQTNSTKALTKTQGLNNSESFSCDLIQDRTHHFWIANDTVENTTHRSYLLKYNKEWALQKKYPLPKNVSWVITGTRLVEDKAGKIWGVASNGKVVRFDPISEQATVFDYSPLISNNSSGSVPTSLYQDQEGVFWIGTQTGLVKMNVKEALPKFAIFTNSVLDRKSLSNNYVSGMINDPYQPNKYLWVSTKGGGLERLDKQNATFEHFTEKQGLPNKVVYGILEDEHKNLWMSTNRGLSQLNPQTLIFKNYTKADGLQDDEFNTNALFKAPTGELLFGGLNGLNIFRAGDFQNNGLKPVVQIVDFKINNQSVEANDTSQVLSNSIEYTQSITLAHDQNQLSFELAVMDFTNPAKNRYRYQLVGISKTWIEVGTNPIINFSQLSSGSYTLQVSGSTNGELWSDPVTLQIRVTPPFYATWWAYLIYVGFIAAFVWLWNQTRTQRLLLQQELVFKGKEADQMAELDVLKTRFFTNISHEFRTPLTLILNLVNDLGEKYPNDSLFVSLKRNSQRLLMLINQLLDLSKLEVGQMTIHIQRGDLARFIYELTQGFDLMAQNLLIDFQFEQNRQEAIVYFDADFVEKILTNLLANALKFTPKGGKIGLSVEFDASLDSVNITIQDNGIGISPEKLKRIFERFFQADSTQKRAYEGTGIGLALVKEIVDLHKGTIKVQSQEGAGTTFVVNLPINEQMWAREGKISPVNTTALEYRSINPEALPVLNKKEVTEVLLTTDDENILLLVEDNAELRHYIRSIFEAEYRIIVATDGQDGLEKALEAIPDLVICDLMMPRMDGFEFCQRLKSDEKTNHIPVLMLTAKTNVVSKIQGHEAGADGYLTKPFYREELVAIVNNLILQRNTLRQKYEVKVVSLKPDEIKATSLEERFMTQVKATIERHISESDFGVEQFAALMNITPVVLRRKLKAITNQSITEYVRNYRLQRAADLLREHSGTVSEVAYQVGFENVSYFGKVFQDLYGKSPSEYSKL